MKSYAKYYWVIYSGIYGILFILNLTHVMKSIDAMIPLFICWILVLAVFYVESRRFSVYLKKHHRHVWDEITSSPFFGPGGTNSFRSLPFLFSKKDYKDERLAFLKSNCRKVIVLIPVVLISILMFALLTR